MSSNWHVLHSLNNNGACHTLRFADWGMQTLTDNIGALTPKSPTFNNEATVNPIAMRCEADVVASLQQIK